MDNKRSSRLTTAEADVEFQKSVKDLTEAIVEDLEAGYQSELEPFEAYANRIRHQVHENLEQFRDRFLQGYDVLIEEIRKQDSNEKKS